MNGYRQVGPEVPVGYVEIGVADVLPVREQALTELLPVALNKRTKVKLTDDGVSCTDTFGIKFSDPDLVAGTSADRHVSVMSSPGVLPQDWKFALRYRQYWPDNSREVKFVQYSFGTLFGEMHRAVKSAHFILGSTVLMGTPEGPVETITQTRKAYERAITPADCTFLSQLLTQTVKRAKA